MTDIDRWELASDQAPGWEGPPRWLALAKVYPDTYFVQHGFSRTEAIQKREHDISRWQEVASGLA